MRNSVLVFSKSQDMYGNIRRDTGNCYWSIGQWRIMSVSYQQVNPNNFSKLFFKSKWPYTTISCDFTKGIVWHKTISTGNSVRVEHITRCHPDTLVNHYPILRCPEKILVINVFFECYISIILWYAVFHSCIKKNTWKFIRCSDFCKDKKTVFKFW